MSNVPYTLTDTTISAVIGFVPRIIPKSHPNFETIKSLLVKGATEAKLLPLLDIPKAIEDYTGGDVFVKNGKLFYKGYEVRSTLATLILSFIREGNEEGAAPFKAFLAKAFANPDPRAALDLYDWVVHSGLPITPDGDILAWKAVRADYGSIHGGRRQFDHHVGNIVEQPREECDANPDQTCSAGLHFCAGPYLKSYASGGSRIVAVKISPTDVVAFPKDYGWEKGRACRYEIVGEIPLEQVPSFYPQGRRLYSGFNSTPTPTKAKTSTTRVDTGRIIEKNGRYVLENAQRQTVGSYAYRKDAVRGAARKGITLAS